MEKSGSYAITLKAHIIATVPLSCALYFITGKPAPAALSFLSGVFIDLDHIYDYLLYSKFKFCLSDFFYTCNNYKLTKFYLLLHSFEILVILWFVYAFTGSVLLLCFNSGYTLHLLLDQFSNLTRPFSYFHLYRISKSFKDVFRNPAP